MGKKHGYSRSQKIYRSLWTSFFVCVKNYENNYSTGDGKMPKKSNITEENLPLIIEDYNNGMYNKEISKKYHIDFTKLKKKLVAEGKIIDREIELSYEQLCEISERYKNGEYLKELAKEYGIGIAKLIARLKSNSLYFKKYEFVNDDELNTYVNEYKNGLTPKEISLKYNRGDSTIINALRKAGIYVEQTSRWTDREIEILKTYYPVEPISDVIKRLPRHSDKQSIFSKASALGIKGYSPNEWTDSEINILAEKYGKVDIKELYELFNKRHTILAIRCKAQHLGFQNDPYWSKEDEDVVRKYYSILPFEELKKLLPQKTEYSIRGVARKLGLKSKYYLDEKYSEEQVEFIRQNCLKMSDEQIAKILNKTPAGIMAQRNKLGFYRIKKDYSKYISLDKFFRGHIQQWKNDSMKNCEYKCVFTGSKDFAIHHIYGFNNILKEVYEILENKNLLKSTKIEDYTKEELDYMLEIFDRIHSNYPLGVCVRKDIHDLFHNIYGSGGNTEEQWNKFYEDFNNGLYDEQIA